MRPALLPGSVPQIMPSICCRRSIPRMALALIVLGAFQEAAAGPFVPAGDAALRADLQLLADHGIIHGPVTTWPLTWGPILADLRRVEDEVGLPPRVVRALARVRDTARRHTRTGELELSAALAGAERPSLIRSFAATP